jgi:hypothetical protein
MSSGMSAGKRAEGKGKGKRLFGHSAHKIAQTTHVFHWLEDELIGKPFM